MQLLVCRLGQRLGPTIIIAPVRRLIGLTAASCIQTDLAQPYISALVAPAFSPPTTFACAEPEPRAVTRDDFHFFD